MEKLSIHFAKGCSQSLKGEIKNILEVHTEALKEKYLGMPSDVGSAINGAFKFLKDRVWSRVQGWMERCLSTGGKEVLIKAKILWWSWLLDMEMFNLALLAKQAWRLL